MAKKINEAPTVADTILFELETPASSGVMMSDPVAVESVVIYYIERNFARINQHSYEKSFYNPVLERQYKEVKKMALANPTEELIAQAHEAKQKMEVASVYHTSYFNDAVQVFKLGGKENPAWHFENPMAAALKSMVFSEQEGREQFGRFAFEWTPPAGSKEGHYVIYWNWTTQSGERMSAHQDFYLGADRQPRTANPVRYTEQDKYQILIDRYMPEMYKYKMKPTDLSPLALTSLNKCVAQGFTEIEDVANQLMDLLDPALAHESVLPVMANMFNVRLNSTDTAMWRRQIGRAVPIYKRKGTLLALKEALDQAGIRLIKVTKLWQVVSPYTWKDGFVIKRETEFYDDQGRRVPLANGTVVGKLSKLPYNLEEYEVFLKPDGEDFLPLPKAAIRLVEPLEGDKYFVIWQGDTLETPIYLFEKDVLLIKYGLQPVPDDKRTIEDYIQSLPLMDKRDETQQVFPPKNWNVHVIEEDDPLIEVIVPSRHPFHEPVVFGKTRTDFLYSEKAYNMDAYDGSLRESNVPCDIDKDFVDTCASCHSSCFTVDIEIEELSDDRIQEAKEIIKEYSPFHAVLHSMNISGSITEFVISPIETIETLVSYVGEDMVATNNKSPEVLEYVRQTESISYEIEWSDGTKEVVNLDDLPDPEPPKKQAMPVKNKRNKMI